MGPRAWLGRRSAITEAAPAASPEPTRHGYEFGVPEGGTGGPRGKAASQSRADLMQDLYNVYMSCSWSSDCIDVISRTITAGGLRLVVDDDLAGEADPPDTPAVQRLRLLFKRCNAREDLIQLCRGTVADLLVFGDAFIEVVEFGGEPAALYTLDATTMSVDADEHGDVTGYTQVIPGYPPDKAVHFEPEQVIHISLDSPRGGIYGVSPTRKQLIPIKQWLFTAATLTNEAKQGFPLRIHIDLPNGTGKKGKREFRDDYAATILGPLNVGNPLLSEGGGVAKELGQMRLDQIAGLLRDLRDTIVSGYGCPPRTVGIEASGSLGGTGAEEGQAKTMKYKTCDPIANLLLEKLTYRIVQLGFGIMDRHLEFEDIDWRDSKTVEDIRDMRLRNGAYILNRYRDDIGEPEVEGGDVAVLIDRGNIVSWKDIERYTEAEVVKLEGSATPPPAPQIVQGAGALPNGGAPATPIDPATEGKPPRERGPADESRAITEAWVQAYRHRRKQTLKELPTEVEV
jgi:hypothetical protein